MERKDITKGYKRYLKGSFPTPSGKIELYSKTLEELGYDPLPQYQEPPETPCSRPDLLQTYPLILITSGRHLHFYHSEHRQVKSIRKMQPYSIIQMNPETAKGLFQSPFIPSINFSSVNSAFSYPRTQRTLYVFLL